MRLHMQAQVAINRKGATLIPRPWTMHVTS